MEASFVPAAEAMPEDRFSWAPTQRGFLGVRTFSEQLLHVGEVNFLLSAAILREKPPVTTVVAEHKAESMQTRTAVLEYLRGSFAYTHKALASISEENARLPIKHPLFDNITTRLGLGIVAVAHPFNHYGQLVEYLRMNNIIPPASRQ